MTAEQQNTTRTRAPLPRVSRVLPLGGNAVRLELENGDAVTLGENERAALSPVPPYVLACEWGRPASRVLAVPAELLPELLPYFPPLTAEASA